MLTKWICLLLLSYSSVSSSLKPFALQYARLPCPSLSPRVCSHACPLNWWFHPTIASPVVPLSQFLQSFPASWYFPVNWLFTSGGQNIGASAAASVLPMNIQSWFTLGLTGLISFLSTGLSRVFSSSTIQKQQFFGTQPFFMAPLILKLAKNLPSMQETLVRFLGWEDLLEMG